MLVAVCADPHLHTQRVEQFARQAREAGAVERWCLGDVVDALLGAPPEVLADAVALAEATFDLVLAGNHELWTLQRGLLTPESEATVKAWPAVDERHGVGVVHASLDDPFLEFVTTPAQAGKLLRGASGWLALHGHTHTRRLWAATTSYPHAEKRPTRGVVEAGADTLLACPGALTGTRPTWLLVDLQARTLEWRALR